MDLDLPVLLGTLREGRESDDVACYVAERIRRKGWSTRVWDPRDMPWAENLLRREWEFERKPAGMDDFVRAMGAADGFVVVTPEYNYGLPGALKNMLDLVYDEWNRKPFGMVTTGGISGGLRAADQLRQVISGLGAVCVPKHVPVPFVGKTFDEHGPTRDEEDWAKRFDAFLDEVAWYARALARARREQAQAAHA